MQPINLLILRVIHYCTPWCKVYFIKWMINGVWLATFAQKLPTYFFVKGLGAGGQLCWVGLDGVGGVTVSGGLPCQLPRSPSPGFRWHRSSPLSTFLLNWYCTRVVLIESRPIYVYQQIHCCWLCWKILLSSVLWIGILSRLPDLRHSDGKYKQQYKRTSVQSRNHWGATEWIRKRWTYC